MKTHKRLKMALIGMSLMLLCYIVGYLHFVRPMPVRVDPAKGESVEPVFSTGRYSIIRLFRPAVAIDQALFPSRWELKRFQLASTDMAGLLKMAPFRARVESVGRTTPHNTGISNLHLGLRLESGHFLQIVEPGATEQIFAISGALMDYQLHEFPGSFLNAK